ncbi:hypothetical protein FXB41_13725 [Bradyrhizobium canariense]|uniref:O-antigen ligase family protein n=1 Tax=Bradyrhizobium canariense TaxID=255045 RepID=UPI001CA4747D|nr:hypothetical protein [Bradyrhizobium canariense]MBW5435804.1 hypothetical protein [Bradyrhizobium canariense]
MRRISMNWSSNLVDAALCYAPAIERARVAHPKEDKPAEWGGAEEQQTVATEISESVDIPPVEYGRHRPGQGGICRCRSDGCDRSVGDDPCTHRAVVRQTRAAMVFGEFDAAPAQFTMLLSFVILAAATSSRFAGRGMLALGLALARPVAAFAASEVRFTFLALAVVLATVALLDASVVSRTVARAVLGIAFAPSSRASCALAHNVALVDEDRHSFGWPRGRAPLAFHGRVSADPDRQFDCDPEAALRILPRAGLFGIGLDRFAERSCIRVFAPHNAFMQAAVEFGWIAGAALLVLLFAPLDLSMVKLARISTEARFALAGCRLRRVDG